uniref:Uncharacterized protein n=1 Tax=Caenorhabditis brenneri TaxID=135651 RepID=B6VBF1_CAEBE|nr:hypothetical protein Cbre_JD07.011 [Caenorhabditis brenneri]
MTIGVNLGGLVDFGETLASEAATAKVLPSDSRLGLNRTRGISNRDPETPKLKKS